MHNIHYSCCCMLLSLTYLFLKAEGNDLMECVYVSAASRSTHTVGTDFTDYVTDVNDCSFWCVLVTCDECFDSCVEKKSFLLWEEMSSCRITLIDSYVMIWIWDAAPEMTMDVFRKWRYREGDAHSFTSSRQLTQRVTDSSLQTWTEKRRAEKLLTCSSLSFCSLLSVEQSLSAPLLFIPSLFPSLLSLAVIRYTKDCHHFTPFQRLTNANGTTTTATNKRTTGDAV